MGPTLKAGEQLVQPPCCWHCHWDAGSRTPGAPQEPLQEGALIPCHPPPIPGRGGWVRRTGQKQPQPPKPPAQAVEGCPWLAVPQETPQDALSATPGGTRTLEGARFGEPTGETPLLPSPGSPQARLGAWAVGGLSRCRARLSPTHAGQKAWQPLPAPFYPQRLSKTSSVYSCPQNQTSGCWSHSQPRGTSPFFPLRIPRRS